MLYWIDHLSRNRIVRVSFFGFTALIWFSWLNGSWINEDIRWNGHEYIRTYNYWDWRPITTAMAFTGFAVICYAARCLKRSNRRLFGLGQILVGLTSGAIILSGLALDDLVHWLALLVSAAFVVQGLENYEAPITENK